MDRTDYKDLYLKEKARAEKAERERDENAALLADAYGLPLDWAEVCKHRLDEDVKATISTLTEQLAEAREGRVTRAMIDRLVEAELDYALSCTNGGAPSSEKQQELSRELAEARQAVRATLSRLEKQEGEA